MRYTAIFLFLFFLPITGSADDRKYFDGSKGKIHYGIYEPSLESKFSGNIVFLPGRRETFDMYPELIELLQIFGYRVYAMEWMGMGYSGRMIQGHPEIGHIDSFDTYVEDLDIFLKQIVNINENPITIIAHSTGAHITLRYLMEHPHESILKAVLSAPLILAETGAFPYWVARNLTRTAMSLGLQEGYYFQDYDLAEDEPFKPGQGTEDERQWLKRRKTWCRDNHTQGYSWGWLQAMFDSTEQFLRDIRTHPIDTPILMLIPGKDDVTQPEASLNLCKQLPNAISYYSKDAEHMIFHQGDKIRKPMLFITLLYLKYSKLLTSPLMRYVIARYMHKKNQS